MTALIAARATGLLAEFGPVLAPADVHVARRLGVLTGETDERVLLAVALTVRGTRHGSVVLDLATAADTVTPDVDDSDEPDAPVELPWPDPAEWISACAASPVVTGAAGGPPLQMVGGSLWLDRYWRQEVQVADDLLRLRADRPEDLDPAALRADLGELFEADDDQRAAVELAAQSRLSVIAGGPGTGKTTTVAQLIAVLRRRLGPTLRIALAAPTGKAAARLEEAVHAAAGRLSADDQAALAALSASTLHRLLGWRPGSSTRFRHDRTNHLPYDVVIVDESSMVSLTLMARLLEALAPATRLVLVGDPDQLASVEAGAVLGDLVESAPLRESIARLHTVRRFTPGGSIDELAELVRAGRSADALALLRAGSDELSFHEIDDEQPVPAELLADIEQTVVRHEGELIAAARAGEVVAALDALDAHRLLCAHRAGPRGVAHWTALAERWLPTATAAPRLDGHYPGEPLLVTANDYEAGVYNGDTGVVVAQGDELAAAFRRGGAPTVLPLVRLGEVRPLHAMTVHRAQGSQFHAVTVLLPFATSPLATRQTFYTAITRAVSRVRLVGSAEAVLACVDRPIARATGLRARLAAPLVSRAAES
jgi:exodeoxyribonuclease V alpha subunit